MLDKLIRIADRYVVEEVDGELTAVYNGTPIEVLIHNIVAEYKRKLCVTCNWSDHGRCAISNHAGCDRWEPYE